MKTIDQEIADLGVFADLGRAHLDLVAGCARNVTFDEGSYVFREGDPADTFYAIRHGLVALEFSSPGRETLVIETLGEGEILGWSWLFEPYRSRFDARAVEPVRAISFDGACLRGKCETDHELGYLLMHRFAEIIVDRLQATRIRLMDIYGPQKQWS